MISAFIQTVTCRG